MNQHEHGKNLRLTNETEKRESSRQNIRLLYEIKARQQELEGQIEDLRQAEVLLRQTTKHFADFYEFSPIAFVSFSPRGQIQEHNKRFTQLLGTTRVKSIGRSFTDYLNTQDHERFLDHIRDVLSSQESKSLELRLNAANGNCYFVEITSSAWYEVNQGSTVVRSSIHDVSDRDALNVQLNLDREEAVAASEAKTQFLSNMSHEIRTPLSVIIGYADFLRDNPYSPDMENGLSVIHRNGNHLLNLVDDLLDLSKVEAGKLTIETLPFQLESEMHSIIHQFQKRAETKGIGLSLLQSTPLPQHIYTDPIRFRQIILNVLSNALKFTIDGGIEVEMSFGEVSDTIKKNLVRIDIKDSGCGMSDAQSQMIFEPFVQAESSTTRQFGGTGLGLSLSRRFAVALGGDVVLLQSEESRGSTFRITIDPHIVDNDLLGANKFGELINMPHLRAERSLPSLAGIKILVVEDGLDNQALIKKLLENVGAEVVCAQDGELGIDHALREAFHVVLMDLGLPGIDGYDAMTELRRLGYKVPIIALTAHALDADRQKAEALGFDDFIPKPIDWPKLADAIVRCHNSYVH